MKIHKKIRIKSIRSIFLIKIDLFDFILFAKIDLLDFPPIITGPP